MFAAPMICVMLMVAAAEVVPSLQRSRNESFYCLTDVAGGAADDLDADFIQCHLRTASNASANQNVNAEGIQYPRQRAVPVLPRGNDAGAEQFSVLRLINGKFRGVSEVLEHFAVFTGDSDDHFRSSCFGRLGINSAKAAPCTACAFFRTMTFRGRTQQYRMSAYQGKSNLSMRGVEQPLESPPGNPHPGRRLLLGYFLQIAKPHRLQFIRADFQSRRIPRGTESSFTAQRTNVTLFFRSRHNLLPYYVRLHII